VDGAKNASPCGLKTTTSENGTLIVFDTFVKPRISLF
jgi:hypothetical protein